MPYLLLILRICVGLKNSTVRIKARKTSHYWHKKRIIAFAVDIESGSVTGHDLSSNVHLQIGQSLLLHCGSKLNDCRYCWYLEELISARKRVQHQLHKIYKTINCLPDDITSANREFVDQRLDELKKYELYLEFIHLRSLVVIDRSTT